jgi:hypothetical protein
VLVRPDGYAGAIVASHDVEALESYFRNVGLGVEGRGFHPVPSATA